MQAGIAAGLGEGQQIVLHDRVKVHELVVHLHGGVVAVLRHDAGDIAGDAAGVKILQHADALIALLHVEAAHVLIAGDGVTDALIQMGHAQVDPLGGKLGLETEQRHKVGRKRRCAARGLGTNEQLQRDLYLAERDLVLHRDVLQNIVQYGQKRRLPGVHLLAVIALALPQGFLVAIDSICTVHDPSPPQNLYISYKIIIAHLCGIYKEF